MDPHTNVSKMKFIGLYVSDPEKDDIQEKIPKGWKAFIKKTLNHFVLQFRAKVMRDPLSQSLLDVFELEHKLSASGKHGIVEHKTISEYRISLIKLAGLMEENEDMKKEIPPLLEGIEWLDASKEDQSNLDRVFAPRIPKTGEQKEYFVTEDVAKKFREAFGNKLNDIADPFFEYRKAVAKSEYSLKDIWKGVNRKDSDVKKTEQLFTKEFNKIKSEKLEAVAPLLRIYETAQQNLKDRIVK